MEAVCPDLAVGWVAACILLLMTLCLVVDKEMVEEKVGTHRLVRGMIPLDLGCRQEEEWVDGHQTLSAALVGTILFEKMK